MGSQDVGLAQNATAGLPEPSRQSETRRRILAVAEELFGKKGIDRTSMRELTAAAEVNLAAVNYHFKSKEQLIEELLAGVSVRVNEHRREALAAYLAKTQAHNAKPSVEPIVETFIAPYVDTHIDTAGPLLAQLLLQHRLSPTSMSQRIVAQHFDPMAQEYVAALSKADTDIPQAEWYWRYLFMVSTVVMVMTDNAKHNRLARLSDGTADASDKENLHRYLCRFLVGGLTAPSAHR